jgi:NAD(P)-dependent dehydrogenase (short-subunit alcohol dehydrogenase family)
MRRLNKPLHILMLNAGTVALPSYTSSADGHELQFATNHLGHFLLARLLGDTLAASAHRDEVQGRVVLVASVAHLTFRYKEGIRWARLAWGQGGKGAPGVGGALRVGRGRQLLREEEHVQGAW